MKNPTRLMFLTTLMTGTLITTSSSSWLGCWVGLEINLLSFIPLMYNLSQFASESALKYFLVQALASSTLLLFVIMMSYHNHMTHTSTSQASIFKEYLILSSLLLKTGAAPFHFWFPVVAEGLAWVNLIILMTWQKLAPFILINYTVTTSKFMLVTIFLSTLVGALGGINQTSLRKIMAYSSINHMGWMLAALFVSETLWMTYFLFYSILSVGVILLFKDADINYLSQVYSSSNLDSQLKLGMFSNILSIGGLPPFLGFLPKWLVIQSMVNAGMTMIITWMVFMSLITLYFYTRITYSALMMTHTELKWGSSTSPSTNPLTSLMSITSICGLVFTMLFMITN